MNMLNSSKTNNDGSGSDLLISPEYLAQITQKHATDPTYGTLGEHYLEFVVEAAHVVNAGSILDYGCGKGNLVTELQDNYDGALMIAGYDPAITEFALVPVAPFDLVTCINVLEHVEPACIDAVLAHIRSLTKLGVIFVIEGDVNFWFSKIGPHFHLEKGQELGEKIFAMCCVPWTASIIERLQRNAIPITDEELELQLKNRTAAAEAV